MGLDTLRKSNRWMVSSKPAVMNCCSCDGIHSTECGLLCAFGIVEAIVVERTSCMATVPSSEAEAIRITFLEFGCIRTAPT
ncbi:MAG: hypothetical protein ACK53Y_15485, partial [bacterium]